ncbi:tyrosine-protein kinase receptor cam-1-like [Centruroides sculpturatus]|uniref:tyrosine-protein kinase receptor cam-1-like n=1 Tax=Centruroides sculpturatus TaxID=218467 RepID=UPI000C6D2EC4|nr:tyrosine-protein kinase receptor cam-1-like [Centruroides sculpturatus]
MIVMSMQRNICILVFVNWMYLCTSERLEVQPLNFPSITSIGDRVSVLCATRTGENLRFTWLKDGIEIKKSNNIQIHSYGDVSTIVIDPVSEEDSGNYTCVVKTTNIVESRSSVLKVSGNH